MQRLTRIGVSTTRIGASGARKLSSGPSGSLIADPLRPERIAKSQSNSLFPTPRFVSFDLWDTLYTPKKPIPEQYYLISHGEFGLDKLLESIQREFPTVYADMLAKYPNYGKLTTDITSCDQWWLELIVKLYGLPHYSTDSTSRALCERLLTHFSSSEAYELYDDAITVLQTLHNNNVAIIAATNSDDRVYAIMESLGIDKYFSAVYLSYDLGYSKPDRRFYNHIYKQRFLLAKRADPLLDTASYLENVWHIGDHYEKDFVGAIKSGWNGILLDRRKQSVFMQANTIKPISNDCFEGQSCNTLEGDDMVMIANNRVCVSGLRPLIRLFGMGED
ncbi:CIC11C00000004812 [Sungouiella intermedia]|uniref:CIC11C00000004812 n=1 Tax=Sungouiella intermedia TaxID=45354 RepID=A0A1L0DB30_9ASCO|nr:CIC11C00000004812 [[Candida] intermedia]SGZ53168.1 CIC11C00000005950 [[Candida] intermedia]